MSNKILIALLFILLIHNTSYSQYLDSSEYNVPSYSLKDFTSSKFLKPGNTEINPALPAAIWLWSAIYFFNPIVTFQNGGANVGLTKEISLGFGYFGEYRIGAEYSLIFKGNQKNQLRLSAKYDYLLKDSIQPSNMLQGTTVLSLGGGYFTDFTDSGIFPEASFGYSIRNDKFLFYPHIKARYTFVNHGSGTNFFDLSAGIIIGFANPFIDLKIRRNDPNFN
ncbi:MAG TPA: hypothetical protein VHP32_09185 [Ignavibacteria bacterium]|nr:hypothetical protein [Ignavibacteria bacterium]